MLCTITDSSCLACTSRFPHSLTCTASAPTKCRLRYEMFFGQCTSPGRAYSFIEGGYYNAVLGTNDGIPGLGHGACVDYCLATYGTPLSNSRGPSYGDTKCHCVTPGAGYIYAAIPEHVVMQPGDCAQSGRSSLSCSSLLLADLLTPTVFPSTCTNVSIRDGVCYRASDGSNCERDF